MFLGQHTEAGGTIPSSLLVTTKKPDIVIVDQKSNTENIFKLTVPGDSRLDASPTIKMESYSHFITDIWKHTMTVTPSYRRAQTNLRTTWNPS